MYVIGCNWNSLYSDWNNIPVPQEHIPLVPERGPRNIFSDTRFSNKRTKSWTIKSILFSTRVILSSIKAAGFGNEEDWMVYKVLSLWTRV